MFGKEKLQFNDDDRKGILHAIHEEMPVFMSNVEFSQLMGILMGCGPRHVLEWGSGGSTAAVLALMPGIESYLSIEHNTQWYERVKALVSDPRLTLKNIPGREPEPTIDPDISKKDRRRILHVWYTRCEEDPSLMEEYVAFPRTVRDSYDFVLVDGRARIHCLRAGYDLLQKGGAMVIHDAQRVDYREAIQQFEHHLFLEPWIQGQICVIRKP